MPEQRAYGFQGTTVHGKMAGEGMAQTVTTEPFNTGVFERSVEGAIDPKDAGPVRIAE
jgi:hypothetical protein